MARTIRSFTISTYRPQRHATPGVASGELRKRVLAGVRGEAPASRGSRPRTSALGSAIVLAAALALTLGLALGRHRPSAPLGARGSGPLAYLRQSGPRGELHLSGMDEPPLGEVYEVWLDHGGAHPQPTDALFTVTSAGKATVEVPGDLRGVQQVLVTAEPLGGSSSPTSAPVLRVTVGKA